MKIVSEGEKDTLTSDVFIGWERCHERRGFAPAVFGYA
jgi:hypothetical protein